MKRNDISGFTIKVLGISLEIVTLCNIPCCIALHNGIRLIKRLEVK
jgi:hypothetical protein